MTTSKEPWTARLIRAGLKIQDKVAPDNIPESIKLAGKGRKGKIVITDDAGEGCSIYLRWNGEHLVEDPDDTGVRNTFTLASQTLQDLIVGNLYPREAIAAHLVIITGERAIYDSEDILRVLTVLIDKIKKLSGGKL